MPSDGREVGSRVDAAGEGNQRDQDQQNRRQVGPRAIPNRAPNRPAHERPCRLDDLQQDRYRNDRRQRRRSPIDVARRGNATLSSAPSSSIVINRGGSSIFCRLASTTPNASPMPSR